MSELANLFNRHDCDKTRKHMYHTVYEPHFEKVREHEINLLEIGTYKAASTKAFYDYFPNAQIYTIDIFVRTNPDNLDILKKERVHWLKADTTIASLPTIMKDNWGDVKFDYVIDDGAHWPMANLLTFRNVMPFLSQDGTYFVEDVFPLEKMSFAELSIPWITDRPDKYNQLDNNAFIGELDNYHTTRHDLRKVTGYPDSYIIEVQHP